MTGYYGQVHLSWTFHKKQAAAHYLVSYSLSNRHNVTPSTNTTATNRLTIENLEPGSYHFSVAKIDGKNKTDELFGWSKAKTFTIYSKDKLPTEVENFEILNVQSDSVRLNWTFDENVDYELTLKDENLAIKRPKRENKVPVTVNNLRCNSNYTVYLSSRNKYGLGEPTISNFTTKKTKPKIKIKNLSTKYLTKSSTEISWKTDKQKEWCGDEIKFVVAFRTVGTRKKAWTEVETSDNSVVLEDLKSKNYEVMVYAKNEIDQGQAAATKFRHSAQFDEINKNMKRPVELKELKTFALDHDTIRAMWQVDSGLKPIDGFKIQWGTEDPFEHEKTVEDKQRFYDIEKLEPDTEYTISVTVIYSLSALNDQTKSRSDPKYRMIKTKPLNDKPPPPFGLKAKVLSARKIRVSWSDRQKDRLMVKDQEYQIRVKNIGPRKGEKKIKHYNCTRSADQDRVFDVEDLRPFTTYDISVRQVLNGKESDWSMTGTARTLEAKPETAPEDFTGEYSYSI